MCFCFLVVSSDLVVDFARCLVSIRFGDWCCVLICRVLVVAAMVWCAACSGCFLCVWYFGWLCLVFWWWFSVVFVCCVVVLFDCGFV